MNEFALNAEEIEARAQTQLGRLFIAFAAIELNLSLQVGGTGTFKEKLERYFELAIARYGELDDDFCKIAAWYMAVDAIRKLRNRFAHGRWGFEAHVQEVIHVAGYPPDVQHVRRLSLLELEAIAADAEALHRGLYDVIR